MAKTTHIIAILDRSGSMMGQEDGVISNFNRFLEEQQAVPGKAKLTLVTFNTQLETIHDKVNLKDVKPLTRADFITTGGTAMNDAIGSTVSKLKDKKKAIVLIHTDGFENSSREFNEGMVKELVDEQKKKWEFIFVGADIDAKSIGGNLGINNTIQVSNDFGGLQRSYTAFACSTTAYRTGNETPEDVVNDVILSAEK